MRCYPQRLESSQLDHIYTYVHTYVHTYIDTYPRERFSTRARRSVCQAVVHPLAEEDLQLLKYSVEKPVSASLSDRIHVLLKTEGHSKQSALPLRGSPWCKNPQFQGSPQRGKQKYTAVASTSLFWPTTVPRAVAARGRWKRREVLAACAKQLFFPLACAVDC
ncbi:hypothetical protein L209DRAFT_147749 [Thermothelomyces heterothallicus CBS 203.75]